MLVVERQGLPMRVLVGSAQRSEVRLAEETLATVKVSRVWEDLRQGLNEVVADKGYDSDPLRWKLRVRGIRPCISRRKNALPGPRKRLNPHGYRERWKVERTFARLFNFRRLIVRWERNHQTFLAFLLITCIIILLRVISG